MDERAGERAMPLKTGACSGGGSECARGEAFGLVGLGNSPSYPRD